MNRSTLTLRSLVRFTAASTRATERRTRCRAGECRRRARWCRQRVRGPIWAGSSRRTAPTARRLHWRPGECRPAGAWRRSSGRSLGNRHQGPRRAPDCRRALASALRPQAPHGCTPVTRAPKTTAGHRFRRSRPDRTAARRAAHRRAAGSRLASRPGQQQWSPVPQQRSSQLHPQWPSSRWLRPRLVWQPAAVSRCHRRRSRPRRPSRSTPPLPRPPPENAAVSRREPSRGLIRDRAGYILRSEHSGVARLGTRHRHCHLGGVRRPCADVALSAGGHGGRALPVQTGSQGGVPSSRDGR